MITSWQIYWITRCEYFQNSLLIIGFISCSLIFFISIFGAAVNDNLDHIKKKIVYVPFLIGLLLIFIGCFIPSTKEMAAILIIPKIANNEKVQQLPNKVLDLANEWLEELKPKVEKK